jgi:AraC-like DNA-binding protein
MVLIGPSTEKACVEVDGASEYIGIRFRAGQTPFLADISPAELKNSHAELSHIQDVSIESLAERMLALPNASVRQQVMEDMVRGIQPMVCDDRCRQAADLLEAHGGRLRVSELAARLNLTNRSLERMFLDHLAITPKRLSRLVRLRRLLSELDSQSFTSLADLALAFGYADQSHMIKDFRNLTGRLPSEPDAAGARRVEGNPHTRIVHRYKS